jgi:hypothetical protein
MLIRKLALKHNGSTRTSVYKLKSSWLTTYALVANASIFFHANYGRSGKSQPTTGFLLLRRNMGLQVRGADVLDPHYTEGSRWYPSSKWTQLF